MYIMCAALKYSAGYLEIFQKILTNMFNIECCCCQKYSKKQYKILKKQYRHLKQRFKQEQKKAKRNLIEKKKHIAFLNKEIQLLRQNKPKPILSSNRILVLTPIYALHP